MSTRRRARPRGAVRGRSPPPIPSAARGLFDTALNALQSGQAAQAEYVLEQFLKQVPDHPSARHLLAMAWLESAKQEAAEDAMRAVVAAYPRVAAYHCGLADALWARGALRPALDSFEHAAELEPDSPAVLAPLAKARSACGQHDAALAAFTSLAAQLPNDARVQSDLGVAQKTAGRSNDALRSFRRATALDPAYGLAWSNLGTLLFECALEAEAPVPEEALSTLRRAIAVSPTLTHAHRTLSRALAESGRLDEAEAAARAALDCASDDVDSLMQLAQVQRLRGHDAAAIATVGSVLALAPEHPKANNDMGVTRTIEGRFEDAERHFRRAIANDPDVAMTYENLARVRRFDSTDEPLLNEICRRLQAPDLPSSACVHLGFAAAKLAEDMGQYDRAFRHYAAANAAKRRGLSYSADEHEDYVRRIIEHVRSPAAGDAASALTSTQAPIFIIGMPRSGTTLVEQVLASHSAVVGAGEVAYFSELAKVMGERVGTGVDPYPQCIRNLSEQDLREIADTYLASLPGDAASAPRFTDKMPFNFEHVGLIARVLPNARFVHCVREARDTCVSIFTTHFNSPISFAYDLAEIGSFQRAHDRLMTHWYAQFGDQIHRVEYERLVSDLEPTVTALLAHCGLQFEPACLAFHNTTRRVETASHWQVRQPLYGTSVERWRRFERHLEPLFEALGQ